MFVIYNQFVSAPVHALVHTVACLCAAPVPKALAHMTGAQGMSRWNLGLWNCREVEPGLFTGESLFDGAKGWVRKTPQGDGSTVDSWVGGEPGKLTMRISVRVLASESLGYPAGGSLITLTAWRPQAMTEERWQRLIKTHEAEILMIQAQLAQGN